MPSRILVVDDNKSVVEVLQMDFELRGHKVFVAYDGEAAEKAISENRPDLIILDVMMPKKNGYSVCRDMKADPELSKIPVILLTAKNTKDDVYWGYDSGADAYMTKPYEPRELISLVDQLLKEAKEGKRTVAWTGLADGSVVEQEAFLKKEAGGEALLVNYDFSDDEKDVFSQKYGTGAFRELVHALAWKLNNNLHEFSPVGIIGQYANDNFIVLINPNQQEEVHERFTAVSEPLIRASYDRRDQEVNGISVKDANAGANILVPIMSLSWKPQD